jgi:hypothetical protein
MEVLTSCAHQVGEKLMVVAVSLKITEIQLASQSLTLNTVCTLLQELLGGMNAQPDTFAQTILTLQRTILLKEDSILILHLVLQVKILVQLTHIVLVILELLLHAPMVITPTALLRQTMSLVVSHMMLVCRKALLVVMVISVLKELNLLTSLAALRVPTHPQVLSLLPSVQQTLAHPVNGVM